jgi:hypothetical protein
VVKYTFAYDQLEQSQDEFYNISSLYVDYDDNPAQLDVLYYDFQGGTEEDGLRLGPGTVGNEAGPKTLTNVNSTIVPLDGRIDWFASYNDYATTNSFLDHMHNARWQGYNFQQDLFPSVVVDFDRPRKTIWNYINDVYDTFLAYCGPFNIFTNNEYCPAIDTAGAYGEAVVFEGEDDLTVGPVEFPQDDYTISAWFKTTHNSEQYLLAALDADNNAEPGLALSMSGTGAVTFDHNFPTTGAFTTTVQSGTGYNDGAWHHIAIIREGTQMTLYLDGLEVDTASGGNAADIIPNLVLGRLKDTTSLTYNGSLDELVILPVAVEDDVRLMLMNSAWPAINIDDDFVPFHVDAASSTTINGSAGVNPHALNSSHIFEQEVEAALELQIPIDIPIVDPASGNLQIFAPFEDVPGSTQFENIAGTDELICPIVDACPLPGCAALATEPPSSMVRTIT